MMLRLRVFTICILFIIRFRFPKDLSIATIIKKRYGINVVKSIRAFEKLDFKRRKVELDISYLKTCKLNSIIPRFCIFKTANKSLRNSSAYLECQEKLLNEEIKIKKRRLKTLEKEFELKEQELSSTLNYIDFIHINHLFTNKNKSTIKKIELI